MKYQKIDQNKELRSIRQDKAAEAKFSVWLAKLDQAQYQRLIKNDQTKSKELEPLIKDADKRVEFHQNRLEELKKLGAKDPAIKNTQTKWLNQRIEELERDHVRVKDMIEHAKVYGENVAKLKWDLSVIEAAHAVCTSELGKLNK